MRDDLGQAAQLSLREVGVVRNEAVLSRKSDAKASEAKPGAIHATQVGPVAQTAMEGDLEFGSGQLRRRQCANVPSSWSLKKQRRDSRFFGATERRGGGGEERKRDEVGRLGRRREGDEERKRRGSGMGNQDWVGDGFVL
jgi:hypothetical protein